MNDGSTDRTEEMVRQWCEEDKLPIRYYYQENQGKHVATNFIVAHCDSEMYMGLDSDDALLPNALETFYEEWESIPDKENYKGVSGRCVDPETGKVIGPALPKKRLDTTPQDLRLKYRHKGEMGGFNRTAVMREFPFVLPDKKARFCPENIVWYEMGKKYKERDVDIPVRLYYHDTTNAITHKSSNRSYANYYLWKYGVNNLLGYIWYSPVEVMKNVVGMSMDGFKTGRSLGDIIKDADSLIGKTLVLLLMPAGWILSKR